VKKYLILILFAIIFLTGCVPQTLYYWNNYSQTLYNYKKNPSDEALTKHMKSLETIIKKSEMLNRAVPPGVYCEYGYYLVQSGNITAGQEYFNLEVQKYPESAKFVQIIQGQLQADKELDNE
jgi:hypothetical protein